MVSQSKTEMRVTVELSRRDRLLLKRIADAIDPVTEPKSGPRRLVEPAYENPEWAIPKETVDRIGRAGLKKLASAAEDDRIALTAEEVDALISTHCVERGLPND